MNSKFFIKKWDGKHARVTLEIFEAFGDSRVPDNTVLAWRTKKGEIQRIKKSAIAEAFEIKKETQKKLPERASKDFSEEAQKRREEMIERMRSSFRKGVF